MLIKFSDKMQMSPKSGKVPSPEMVKSKNDKRPATTMSASQNQMFRPHTSQKMAQIPMNATQQMQHKKRLQ